MKKILISLLVFITLPAGAQTYIKTNALYWAVLLPNVGVETRLSNHFTFEGEVNGSLWKSIDDRPYLGMQVMAGGRYYIKESFKGFYVGGDISFDVYEASKWDHWNNDYGGIDVQHGVGVYLGVTLGYQMPIGRRWNMDFYAGGGWHHGWYWGDTKMADGSHVMYAGWNRSGEWIPYKAGVTFAYRLTSEKRMQKRFGGK